MRETQDGLVSRLICLWWVPAPQAQALRKLHSTIEGIGHSRLQLLPDSTSSKPVSMPSPR
ncbi:MAG: hypothetical protein INH41_13365 [Myxococcaceae bacterium]|nr:hypothetical protein [Myxococcaceae bacterium]MCA3013370.1 hypothetical protein [Myxococcaceae bacterium]